MIGLLLDLAKGFIGSETTSRLMSVKLADSYLGRLSGFQEKLVLLGIALNFAAVIAALKLSAVSVCNSGAGFVCAALIFFANMLLARIYFNEHRTTKLLFARYPELELIMPGDKSWSNFKLLAGVYKMIQAGWLLYSAALAGFFLA